ncbi:MAG: DUF6470 family protein, partial [Alicyclobacillaceae bacterium]|nr:DUF6470 family protein [Alicyclobacillaceae bacterium]
MIPQIQIDQQFARIGLERVPAEWRITSPPAELNMHQELPRLEIRQIPGKLDIDQSEAFAQEGLMSIFDLNRKEAERARRAALEGIAETAEWGDRFAHIERGGNPIADWAARNVGRRADWIPVLMPE